MFLATIFYAITIALQFVQLTVYIASLVDIRVVNLGPVYTIPGSGFPGILDL